MPNAKSDEPIKSPTKSRALRGIMSATLLLFLSACGSTESAIVIASSVANFVHTDKLPTDYIAEFASGKECNLLKSIEDGGPMCRNTFSPVIVERPLYCYRTIGKPTCYSSPDPHRTGAQPIR